MDVKRVRNKQQVLHVLDRYDRCFQALGANHIQLFGSFLRNSQIHSRSDVDLLIDFDSSSTSYDNKLLLKQLLEKLMGRRVDLVDRKTMNPHMGKSILANIANPSLPLDPEQCDFNRLLCIHDRIAELEYEYATLDGYLLQHRLLQIGWIAGRITLGFKQRFRAIPWSKLHSLRRSVLSRMTTDMQFSHVAENIINLVSSEIYTVLFESGQIESMPQNQGSL